MHNMIKVEFTYQWIPILKEEGQEYHFPEEISSFMRKNYRKPAIYRWNVFRNIPSDKKIIYIGEAQELCPQRINGYLYPGPSQRTNNRIKKIFKTYLDKGFKIRLEILHFGNIKIGDFTLSDNDLKDRHIRRFVEELMIIIHRQKGYEILNL